MDSRTAIKMAAVGLYDIQKQRIQTGQRVVANFRVQLGIAPSTKEEDADDDVQDVLDVLRTEYKTITEGVSRTITRKTFKPVADGLITDFAQFCLVSQWVRQVENEEQAAKQIESLIEVHPVYPFLESVKGCGRLMSAVIIAYLDPHKARHVSSFWKYCGLDVGPNGRGRSRRKEHLVERQYTDKDGKEATRMGTTFNPWVKTKLRGVLAGCLLKAQGHYSEVYYNYKNRMENHAVYGIARDGEKLEDGTFIGKSKRHEMSLRYMIKMFLADLWVAWRTVEGLPVTVPYAQAKLGMPPHGEEAA